MKIKLESGVEYSVKWRHENTTNETGNKYPSFTECFIENLTNNEIKGEAKAILSPTDNFNKDKGRKISMKRAMKIVGLAKPTRKLFWSKYFEMTNNHKYKYANIPQANFKILNRPELDHLNIK